MTWSRPPSAEIGRAEFHSSVPEYFRNFLRHAPWLDTDWVNLSGLRFYIPERFIRDVFSRTAHDSSSPFIFISTTGDSEQYPTYSWVLVKSQSILFSGQGKIFQGATFCGIIQPDGLAVIEGLRFIWLLTHCYRLSFYSGFIHYCDSIDVSSKGPAVIPTLPTGHRYNPKIDTHARLVRDLVPMFETFTHYHEQLIKVRQFARTHQFSVVGAHLFRAKCMANEEMRFGLSHQSYKDTISYEAFVKASDTAKYDVVWPTEFDNHSRSTERSAYDSWGRSIDHLPHGPNCVYYVGNDEHGNHIYEKADPVLLAWRFLPVPPTEFNRALRGMRETWRKYFEGI